MSLLPKRPVRPSRQVRAEIAADSDKSLTQPRLTGQTGRLHQQPRVRGLSDQIAVLNRSRQFDDSVVYGRRPAVSLKHVRDMTIDLKNFGAPAFAPVLQGSGKRVRR